MPETITIETILLKDMVMMNITAMLNVDIEKTMWHLHNIDNRIMNGKITIHELSVQVKNAYNTYIKWLPIVDNERYEATKQYR
jgi:hypothetical protein